MKMNWFSNRRRQWATVAGFMCRGDDGGKCCLSHPFQLDVHTLSSSPLGFVSLTQSPVVSHSIFSTLSLWPLWYFFFLPSLCLSSCGAQRNISKTGQTPIPTVWPRARRSACLTRLYQVDHVNNELSHISKYRVDHRGQAKGSVKCGDDRSLQCQRLGCDILQRSGLESLAATLPSPSLPPSPSLFASPLSLHSLPLCLIGAFDSQEAQKGR